MPEPLSSDPIAAAREFHRLAGEHQRRGAGEAARHCLHQALRLDPQYQAAWLDLGIALIDRGNYAAALACLKRAEQAGPPLAAIPLNLAVTHINRLDFEAAIAAAQQALALAPDWPRALFVLGFALHRIGRDATAIEWLGAAASAEPANLVHRFYRALARLRCGDIVGGAADYEVRFALFGQAMMPASPVPLPAPPWEGEELAGRSLLILSEQGFGDILQFIRFFPPLIARGVRIVFRCHYVEIMSLLRATLPEVTVVGLAGPIPAVDYQIPMMSMLRYLGADWAEKAVAVPYLRLPPGVAGPALPRPAGTRLAIGLVWGGRPQHSKDSERSMPLEELLALADLPGVALYSLQKGERVADIARLGAGALIHDIGSTVRDFAEMAAVMMRLDLVIAVDTATIHLAGALGRPVFALLAEDADWRWQRERPDTPWYPTMRLFRQKRLRDWRGMMAELREAVGVLAAAATPLAVSHLPGDAAEAPRLFAAAWQRQQAHDRKAAITLYERVLALRPGTHEAYNNLALLLRDEGRLPAALACLKRGLLHDPTAARLHHNLGALLAAARRYEEAVASFTRALESEPGRAETLHSLAWLLTAIGDSAAAISCYDRLLALAPDDAAAQWGRGRALLAGGDLAAGFAEGEARLRLPGEAPAALPIPLWQGEDRAGRVVLVHAERDPRDTLFFVRYLPLLAERGMRIIFRCPAVLLPLLRRSFGAIAEVIDDRAPLPAADFHLPLASLAARFGGMTGAVPYLAPPADAAPALPRPGGSRLALGLAWAAPPRLASDPDPSLPLEPLLALADLPGVALFGVQPGGRAGDIAGVGAEALVDDLGSGLGDFAAMASVLRQLDLVVSVDAAVAHLAGALGRPVFLVLPYATDWRWRQGREDTPWYPRMRLFRQDAPDDWEGVMARLRAAVASFDGDIPGV